MGNKNILDTSFLFRVYHDRAANTARIVKLSLREVDEEDSKQFYSQPGETWYGDCADREDAKAMKSLLLS